MTTIFAPKLNIRLIAELQEKANLSVTPKDRYAMKAKRKRRYSDIL